MVFIDSWIDNKKSPQLRGLLKLIILTSFAYSFAFKASLTAAATAA